MDRPRIFDTLVCVSVSEPPSFYDSFFTSLMNVGLWIATMFIMSFLRSQRVGRFTYEETSRVTQRTAAHLDQQQAVVAFPAEFHLMWRCCSDRRGALALSDAVVDLVTHYYRL